MLLSSSLEPNGQKSKLHYLVLHFSNTRHLIKLPPTYSELKNEVNKLFHLHHDSFFVETKELNICAGERIRILEGSWSDIAELLGNVYVVEDVAGNDVHPESAPEASVVQPSNSSPIQTTIRKVVSVIPDPKSIYDQILSCDQRVIGALETIRREIPSGPSTRRTRWRRKNLQNQGLTDTDWDFQPHSVFVIRYNFTEGTPKQFDIGFNSRTLRTESLAISIIFPTSVTLGERGQNGRLVAYQSVTLRHAMDEMGEHSIALVHHRDNMYVIFDFKQPVVVQRRTVLEKKPGQLLVQCSGGVKCKSVINVYEFDI